MHFLTTDLIAFLEQYGYLAAFASMLLFGPIGAVASGFFAGLGIFNPWIIWAIDIAADLCSDIFYYELGRHGGRRILDRFGRWFKWSGNLVEKAEWLFSKHGKKTIFIIKFTQGIGSLTQAIAGIARMPRRDFLLMNSLSATIKSAILILVGMLAGTAWETWATKIDNIAVAITSIVGLVLVAVFVSFQIQSRVMKKIEGQDNG